MVTEFWDITSPTHVGVFMAVSHGHKPLKKTTRDLIRIMWAASRTRAKSCGNIGQLFSVKTREYIAISTPEVFETRVESIRYRNVRSSCCRTLRCCIHQTTREAPNIKGVLSEGRNSRQYNLKRSDGIDKECKLATS